MSPSNQWVVRANISDFKQKLEGEKDADKRRVLELLLAKEQEKLASSEKDR